jgi:L-ascorbate metabolism protein UlaG (beta-lactamase superfamily)
VESSAAVERRQVTYLGHASLLIERDGTRLLTDPLLRSHLTGFLRRRHDIPELETAGLGAVLISHVHHDHLDLPTLRRIGRHTPIVVPAGAGPMLAREGFVDVREVEVGEELELGSIRVEVTDAVHEAKRRRAPEPPALGYLFGEPGELTYFPGDTAAFEGMEAIAGRGIDLALLPIWGWGPTLGPGHMNPEQAAEALTLLQARRAVPIHWGTYTPIGAGRIWPWMSERPAREFAAHAAQLAPGVEVTILEPGESVPALGG